MYARPIHIFDEAIYANNSLEMAQNNEYMVYTNNGTINHYNTKPPFVLILQALSFKLFSYSEFALRLPTLSALAGIFFLLYRSCVTLRLPLPIGILSAYILLTTPGAIRTHVFLTGDLDGVLVFFTTLIVFNHLKQLHEKQITSCSIACLFLGFTLGYFTKSTAILLILPSIIISYAYEGLLLTLLKNRFFYLYLSLSVVAIVLYYVVREKYDPGYFDLAFTSEFKRYTSNVLPWHVQPVYFYFEKTITQLNPVYTLITAILSAPYFYLKTAKYKRIVFNLFFICITYIVVISISKVKLEWYEAPVFPLWSFALAVMIFELYFPAVKAIANKPAYRYLFFSSIFLFTTFQSIFFYNIFKYNQENIEPQEKEGSLIKQLIKTNRSSFYTVLIDAEENSAEQYDVLNFYVKSAKLNNNITINVKTNIGEVAVGDTLIVSHQPNLDSLENKFYTNTLCKNKLGKYLVIDSLK